MPIPPDDYPYQVEPFEAPPPLLGKAGAQFKGCLVEKGFSGRHMATLKPRGGKRPRDETFESHLLASAEDYRLATGTELKYAGQQTRGKNGRSKPEAHLVFLRSGRVNWVALKKAFRSRFDLVVTGEYGKNEPIPTKAKLKNRPPHDIVLDYVASHADHPGAGVLWNLGTERRKKRTRKRKRALPSMKQTFSPESAVVSVGEDEGDL